MGCNDKDCNLKICGTGNVGPKGQVVIPKDVRDSLGISPGDSVTFMMKGEQILGIIPSDNMDAFIEYLEQENKIQLKK